MRHGKKVNHLGRTAPHRKALMANMASSLIIHKRITTTLAKAKALRTYVEPLITKGKDATTHNQRTVFAYLKDKEAVKELFTVVGAKVANRPGGYTRILKVGNRMGDNAEMAFIELVDFNEYFQGFGTDKKEAKKTRRGRSKASSNTAKTTVPVEATPVVAEEVEAEVIEETAAPVENVVTEETTVVETSEETQPEVSASAEETTSETETTEASQENTPENQEGEEENKPE
ncbi:MAG: 50S ribosomal protein L17 [Bacteroidetes bacterium]|jgi:large subunit ribosomal protein L17|nr:50S ribosomal protein L17 [Bacteroidota bacterium]